MNKQLDYIKGLKRYEYGKHKISLLPERIFVLFCF